MTELQAILDLEADVVTEDGRTLRMGPTSLEVIAAWESMLAADSYRFTFAACGDASGARQAVAAVAALGEFNFDSTTSVLRMNTPEGRKKLACLRIKQNHPDIPDKIIADAVQYQWEKVASILANEEATLEAHDPNASAPAKAGETKSSGEQSLPESAKPTTSSPATPESNG
jgi:hypothetical protein